MIKAHKISEIDKAFSLYPLKPDQMAFYRNTAKGRDGHEVRKRIEKLLRQNPDTAEHILFVASRGSGKSTELNRLQKDISDEYLVFNFSVIEELNGETLNYIELYIVTMERLFDYVLKEKIKISNQYIRVIQDWVQSREIEEIRDKYNLSAEAEIGSETEFGIPYLQKFFAKFKASAKASISMKETLKRNVEPRLSELIDNCNALIREIQNAILKKGKKDLLIIIEDLDKISFEAAEDLFFNHASNLSALKANVIYTFPSALMFNIRYNHIRNYFTKDFVMPMIKIKEKDGTPFQDGIDVLWEIIRARMDVEKLFESNHLVERLIGYSGGVLRDLFRLIRDAAENAELDERDQIGDQDCARAYNLLRQSYRSLIADNRVGERLYPVAKYYELLSALAKDPEKLVEETEETMHLRQATCILDYNGTGWQDVHPIVFDILKERKMI